MKRLAIIGSGDLGQQIAYHASSDNHYQVAGFFDDFQQKGILKHGYPILGGVDDVEQVFRENGFDVLMIGIGYKHFAVRSGLYDRFAASVPFGTIIHSSCYVDRSCKVGTGSVVYPGCTLDMGVEIGNNVVLNTGCVIAHDSSIGTHSFLSPGVRVAGFVHVERGVSLGIGTILIDNIRVGAGIRTGAGAVVINDILTPGLYVGVPANFKKPI
ncbi:acetyltransferase [Parasegetibacter sp. NRK P23]|uniref:acetyltransferase n=1 Tax=Parasegetibacter sp. NRK P23 TaxID=2942999 RepID=UPI002043BFA3|nr:acetyltransferase [Parasegetibacter sp. NRK P23]MCM5527636.1 acetyltransferase [Parasegetibacter sp. NRK P23]